MPMWLSQMFFWSIIIIPALYLNAERIDAFLDRTIGKIKRFARKAKQLITAIIKAIILTIKETKTNET